MIACNGSAKEQPATLDKVDDSPHQFIGARVSISGEIDDIYNDRAFELENDGDWLFEDELLVATRSPISFGGEGISDDDEVIVTGTVKRFVVAEIEPELGWDVGQELEVEWKGKPVLIADSIRKVEEYARWSEGEQNVRVGIASVVIVPDATPLAGQQLEVDAVPVRSKAGQGVWVGYSHGAQLFVVPQQQDQLQNVTAGDWVRLEGTLRPMPEAQEAIDRWQIDEALAAQVAQEPLYLEASTLAPASTTQKSAARSAQEQGESLAFNALGDSLPRHVSRR